MIKLKDLLPEEKKTINEFSPMGEIHTALEVWLDGVERPFLNDYISEGNRSLISKKILDAITKVAEKYNGEVTGKYSPAIIEWDYEMDQSEFDDIYNELKIDVENLFNTNLFEFYTSGYHYKSTGVLGTPIGRGKITNWLTKQYSDPTPEGKGSSFGEGDTYQDEYEEFLRNLSNTRSQFDNRKMEYKIGQIVSTYFAQNPQAITRKTDWLSQIKPKIEKMFR